MEELLYVGKPVPRKDGPAKATGRAEYTVDIALPGMLCGKVLRSPYPHAKILRIDTSKAERLSGVKAVVTAKDSLKIKHGFVETPRYPADQYPIAVDRVRYVGEEIAGVAATDESIAEEALSLIEVEYEELPAIFDVEEAMKPDAPEIHPSHPKVPGPYRNIGGKTETAWGDVEKAFTESHLVREDRFVSQLRTHAYMEPQATVASYDYSGKLNVWTSGMGVFLKRAKLAKTLGLPAGRIRVLKSYVGGAFGGKVDLFSHEYITSLLSMKCHLPVKIVYSREEVFKFARHGQPLIMYIKTGIARDGTLLAQYIRTVNDSGGYRGSGVVVIFLAWGFAMIPYRVPNLKYEGLSVYTNNTVRCPRGDTGHRRYGLPSSPRWTCWQKSWASTRSKSGCRTLGSRANFCQWRFGQELRADRMYQRGDKGDRVYDQIRERQAGEGKRWENQERHRHRHQFLSWRFPRLPEQLFGDRQVERRRHGDVDHGGTRFRPGP